MKPLGRRGFERDVLSTSSSNFANYVHFLPTRRCMVCSLDYQKHSPGRNGLPLPHRGTSSSLSVSQELCEWFPVSRRGCRPIHGAPLASLPLPIRRLSTIDRMCSMRARARGWMSFSAFRRVHLWIPLPYPATAPPRLLSNVEAAPGANMVITASKERGGKPSLGASIAMERLRFPVMMQVPAPSCTRGTPPTACI